MNDEWREQIIRRIDLLKQDKKHILELDARLRYQQVISEADTSLFHSCVAMIDKEIETLHFELMLDDMLQSDLPFEEFIKRFNQ